MQKIKLDLFERTEIRHLRVLKDSKYAYEWKKEFILKIPISLTCCGYFRILDRQRFYPIIQQVLCTYPIFTVYHTDILNKFLLTSLHNDDYLEYKNISINDIRDIINNPYRYVYTDSRFNSSEFKQLLFPSWMYPNVHPIDIQTNNIIDIDY